MTDRELLEFAALAANYEIEQWDCWGFAQTKERERWNPLEDDGDALRLAVKLRLDVENEVNPLNEQVIMVSHGDKFSGWFEEPITTDPYTATRRAIVKAAAEIGKVMK